MPEIQVDMFEVQLGAAILLTFDNDGDTVRVLADGGVRAAGYRPDHVHTKLKQLIGCDAFRIDLIIGTHYDEDHLNGLVPIIEDGAIEIGEVWLPPVADDSGQFPVDLRVEASQLLAHRFSGSNGGAVLQAYLSIKRRDIETLVSLEDILKSERSDEPLGARETVMSDTGAKPIDFFREQLAGLTEDGCEHGIDPVLDPPAEVEKMLSNLRLGNFFPFGYQWRNRPVVDPVEDLKHNARQLARNSPVFGTARTRSLTHLRLGAAKDAINASALHAVVQALGNRTRPVPVRCEIIDDGVPRRYRWDAAMRRFVLSKKTEGPRPSLTLLGPSMSLVRKHRDRLPVAETSKVALAFRGEIRSITPSNQLSYIGCFGFADQSILIAGDAGCVDFKPNRKKYHPALLAAMKPLHVIQVAHHAGNNAHFYRVLAAADFAEQTEPSYLLLSHAYHDRTRPSDLFHDFLLTVLGEGEDVKLLFTSEPTSDKVDDFLSAIHPVVGNKHTVGDVQLRFEDEIWTVTRHAIEVDRTSSP